MGLHTNKVLAKVKAHVLTDIAERVQLGSGDREKGGEGDIRNALSRLGPRFSFFFSPALFLFPVSCYYV